MIHRMVEIIRVNSGFLISIATKTDIGSEFQSGFVKNCHDNLT